MYRLIVIVVVVLLAAPAWAQQKRVYIAPDDHTDYWWTADENTYRQVFLDTLDYYLDQMDATAGNPPQYQARWNCDGHFWVYTYEKNRTVMQFNRLMSRVADGHVSVPLNPLCVCYGGAPAEAVIRGAYYPGQLERRFNVRLPLAYLMENQTHPLGVWSLWAGCGAKYSWKGICDCDTVTPSAWDREHDIYRAVGLDGAQVLVKWNSMLFGNQSMGGYAEARSPSIVIDQVTSNAPFNGFGARYPYNVIGCFGKGWDDLQTQTTEFVSTAQAMTDASRQIIVSNEEDFFDDFEVTHGAGLPTETTTYGNEWELYAASMASTSARVKRAVERLRAAEALASIVSLHVPTFMDGRQASRDQAFINMGLFWEHNFGMVGNPTGPSGVTGRINWQRRLADEIDAYVDDLLVDGADQLAALVPTGGVNPRFVAFNPLGWSRTAIGDLPWSSGGPVHAVDVTTDQEIPSQLATVGGSPVLRVQVQSVPPVGYKVIEVRTGAGQNWGDAATVTSVGSPAPSNATIPVAANNRDATSVQVGAPGSTHVVRISGYSVAEPYDFCGSDSEAESGAMAFALNLPADATIHEAYLTVRAGSPNGPSSTGGIEIHMYDTASVAPFADGPLGDLLNHAPTYPATVLWPQDGSWPTGSDQTSPNIASMVQTFIDRPDYVPGNFIGFVVTEGTTQTGTYVGWHDFAAGTGAQPKLQLVYTDPNAPPVGNDLRIENLVYKVTVTERGAITSLIDKTRGDREFAQLVGGRAVNDLGPGAGTLSVENAGPVSVTVKAVSSDPIPHTTRVTLYRDSDRVDIENEITQNFSTTYTYAFGFNLASPDVWHEEVGAILRARLTSNGGHYSTRNARYDWLSMNHFADMSGSGNVGMTLSNGDSLFMKLGNSTTTSLDTSTAQILALVGGRVAVGGNGLPAQGGDTTFTNRFALRAHDVFDPVAAMRMSLEHQNPLIAREVTGANAQLAAGQFSLISSSNPNVLLWAIKPAEEGIADGLITRWWNLASTAQQSTIQLAPSGIDAASVVTHIETDVAAEPVTSGHISPTFATQQIRTFRLQPSSGPAIPAVSTPTMVLSAALIAAAAWGVQRRRSPGVGAGCTTD